MSLTNDPRAIERSLRRYPPLSKVVRAVGPPPAQRRSPVAARYDYLVRAIVHQQLAGRAAETIHGRFVAACGGTVTPSSLDHLEEETLIACGLSGPKRAAIRDLTAHVDAGTVRLDRHARWSDEQVLADLVKVRGIGTWTVQMYQMGPLGRTDVWPVGDLGVRQGWSLMHGFDAMISPRDLEGAAEQLAPHRSAVAWYCWQAVHLERERDR